MICHRQNWGKWNVLSLPSMTDWTARPASIFFASSYTIERPRPVPRRLESALVVKKGSKMRGNDFRRTPPPTSRTEIKTKDGDDDGMRKISGGNFSAVRVARVISCVPVHGLGGVEDEVQEDLLDEFPAARRSPEVFHRGQISLPPPAENGRQADFIVSVTTALAGITCRREHVRSRG